LKLKNKKIVLGVTGSIAAYKSAELIRLLRQEGATVRVILTTGGAQFITPLTLQTLSGNIVRQDMFNPAEEAAIEHIELAKWVDLILIAPASAGIASRLATAAASDILSTVCLATDAPIILAPAMNHKMWQHKVVQKNFAELKKQGIKIIGPIHGDLACGDVGLGKMTEPVDIIKQLNIPFP
jgi:phosphopantothenoylcysteine decarboxylase/phosphopantothenate--cysteine ligase